MRHDLPSSIRKTPKNSSVASIGELLPLRPIKSKSRTEVQSVSKLIPSVAWDGAISSELFIDVSSPIATRLVDNRQSS